MSDRPVTEVAVAVVIDPQSGKFLLGSRPEGKPYAGYWEFPGGKLEKGESVHEALVRELREELDLTITDSVPWFVMEHDYPHAYVRLHFRRSWAFSGTPKALENQTFCWCTAEDTGTLAAMKLLPMDAQPDCAARGAGGAGKLRGAYKGRGLCPAYQGRSLFG